MEFRTVVPLPKAPLRIDYSSSVLMFGSCFADNIGNKLSAQKFTFLVNPVGTIYNPSSIAATFHNALNHRELQTEEIIFHESLFHSYMHHSSFSAKSADELRLRSATIQKQILTYLQTATHLVITWGSAYVYHLNSTGGIVANCHKQPDHLFNRRRLSVEEIVETYTQLFTHLLEITPKLQIILTVSPIRHWKDGANGNQLSKATLLLASDILQQRFPGIVFYFPAYEIVLDELRDYRFYAEDMIHPSSLAVDYIHKRFTEWGVSEEAKKQANEIIKLVKAAHHRPFNPSTEAHQRFIVRTLEQIAALQQRLPQLNFDDENQLLRDQLI